MTTKARRPDTDIFYNRAVTWMDQRNIFDAYLQQPDDITLRDRMEISLQLAFCEAILAKPKEAEVLLNQCRDYILQNSKDEYKGCVYHIECRICINESKYEEGLAAGVMALHLFKRVQLPFFTMNTCILCGYLCGKANLFVEAMDYYSRAHSTALLMNDTAKALMCILNLNDARLHVLSTEECITHSLELAQEIKDFTKGEPDNLAIGNYMQLSHLYIKTNQLDRAEDCINKTEAMVKELPHLPPHHFTYTNLYAAKAEIASINGDEKTMLENAQECIRRGALVGKKEPEIDVCVVMFNFYLKQNQLTKAKENLDRVSLLMPEGNRSDEYQALLQNKCIYYRATGNVAEELAQFKLAYELKEQMQHEALAHRIKYTSLVHEMEVKNLELTQQKADLNTKTQELSMSTYYLDQRNQLLNNLKESIGDLRKQNAKSDLVFKTIINTINNTAAKEEDDKKIFREKFDETQRGFIARLHKLYPLLTPTECRLCALLRSGFNSKEISNLLSMTIRNIENHRTRIRKKMGLGKEDNLTLVLGGVE